MENQSENKNEVKNEISKDSIANDNITSMSYNKAENRNYIEGNYIVYNKTKNVVYYILGVIEVLLLFRLFFKSLGASTNNSLVSALYGITNLIISPFVGIFNIITAKNSFTFIIEPSTIIAMIVYALFAYGIIKLVKVSAIDNYHI